MIPWSAAQHHEYPGPQDVVRAAITFTLFLISSGKNVENYCRGDGVNLAWLVMYMTSELGTGIWSVERKGVLNRRQVSYLQKSLSLQQMAMTHCI